MAYQHAMNALRTLEGLVAKAAGDHENLRRRLDGVYEDRVRDLAKEHRCSMSRAHGLAARDPIAKRAYALGVELQERQRAAMRGADAVGAYLG